jgi:hypothetical protein
MNVRHRNSEELTELEKKRAFKGFQNACPYREEARDQTSRNQNYEDHE